MTNGSIVAAHQKSVLISGIGVAGPALAYWLSLYGFKTTLVEKAEHLRTGGYVIDFWGLGFDVAEKMGILPASNVRVTTSRSFDLWARAGDEWEVLTLTLFAL